PLPAWSLPSESISIASPSPTEATPPDSSPNAGGASVVGDPGAAAVPSGAGLRVNPSLPVDSSLAPVRSGSCSLAAARPTSPALGGDGSRLPSLSAIPCCCC
ncbi:unnamed protein product, partial [Ectocarpus sp. 12 AP-2014]